MDRYQRVEKPKADTLIDENEIGYLYNCIYTQILCFSLLLIPAGLGISRTCICNCWSFSGYLDFGFSSKFYPCGAEGGNLVFKMDEGKG